MTSALAGDPAVLTLGWGSNLLSQAALSHTHTRHLEPDPSARVSASLAAQSRSSSQPTWV